MRKGWIVSFGVLALIVAGIAQQPEDLPARGAESVTGELLVQFKAGATPAGVARALGENSR